MADSDINLKLNTYVELTDRLCADIIKLKADTESIKSDFKDLKTDFSFQKDEMRLLRDQINKVEGQITAHAQTNAQNFDSLKDGLQKLTNITEMIGTENSNSINRVWKIFGIDDDPEKGGQKIVQLVDLDDKRRKRWSDIRDDVMKWAVKAIVAFILGACLLAIHEWANSATKPIQANVHVEDSHQ